VLIEHAALAERRQGSRIRRAPHRTARLRSLPDDRGAV
jgi:hypothetical protein